ncbi:UDP-N-acetylmuramoyl-tripeptide--D-alanyl-D-alanine ligase [Swaminathania salitolerans]|uniref:UDP-N-acetylmuramoyl-tripeptide--D-alanyl-D-alanine ligase n=1 Tax=Swaminathania salitolerans TaxID=182838 RepID=A0A511BPQ8_9PROT|nr:UDP-N-acetylmuramoyl-tripeptide--D-alanyl-D-alanine ligase [Swaminathania salitolerans]GBQ10957.1 UDP-N-acetylmuramoyl-tripeptide--D-alanyl-D-alanine ligase [Swaminathania salitolerans LMG 21291]GEL02245.1 UDP-N-acetylmuramoyl-tripeptide--D-alanyl-D-alanine ligase [Swaminathania salitolerans]
MTALWTSQELRAATGGTLASEIAANGVSIDTRSLAPGDLFIALSGEHGDGHAHVADALARGAAAVMVHRPVMDDPRILHVNDTMEGLRALARFARARFQGQMFAVTGSVGKTTTKNMLRTALSALGPTHAAVASYNNHWGVPLTLARLPSQAAYCVCEIGMNHRGEIAPLAAMVKPGFAIVTTIGSSHLGHMGSLDAIAEEKSDLIASLSPGGTAIVPDDTGMNPILARAAARAGDGSGCRLVEVGATERAGYRITAIQCDAKGSSFRLNTRDVALEAPGRHLVRNAALVVAALDVLGQETGLAIDPAIAALRTYRPGAGRGLLQPILQGQASLLDESYNASVQSIRAALETLALLPARRRIAVLGDIRELGAHAEREHLSLVPDLIAHADLVYCCCPHMGHVFASLPPDKRGIWQEDAASLAPFVLSHLKAGDVVLVKGSLGSRMRDVVSPLLAGGAKA